MPCYEPPGVYGLVCYDETGDCTKRIKAQIDTLTRMLCEANQIIDDAVDYCPARSKELAEWCRKHQALDRERKRKDQLNIKARLLALKDKALKRKV